LLLKQRYPDETGHVRGHPVARRQPDRDAAATIRGVAPIRQPRESDHAGRPSKSRPNRRRRTRAPRASTWKADILHHSTTRVGRLLSRLAPALAIVALVAFATTATATPPSSPRPVTSFNPVAVPLDGLIGEALVGAPAASSPPDVAPDTALADPGSAPAATIAPRSQPKVQAEVFVKPTPKPKPKVYSTAGTGHAIRGRASWYCNNDGSRGPISACHYQYPDTSAYNAYAAAGPKLRAALGSHWRGKIVYVNGLRVKLVDWCQCYGGQTGVEKLIDLYYDVYRRAGGNVTIRW
jgi:hypothetical protein